MKDGVFSMKKKVKILLIAIAAVILVAAIVVGGLILGGVINVGEKRTATASTIEVNEAGLDPYKMHPQVYKTTLAGIYSLSDKDIEDFYATNGEGWNVYNVTVKVKNKDDVAIVISNASSQLNGTGSIWVKSKIVENDYVTVAPGAEAEFTFSVLAKGYDSADAVKENLKALNPSIVFAENPNAADQTHVRFDMNGAEKFAIDIKF